MIEKLITKDYHTHTIYSHGKGTIEDNVLAAINMGLKGVAITDHGFGQPFAGLTIKKFEKMKLEVDTLREKYKDIEILLGVEANIVNMNGDIDLNDELANQMDVILAGYHLSATEWKLKSMFNMLAPAILAKMGLYSKSRIEKNTKTYLKMIQKYNIDVVTHPGYCMPVDYLELGKACADFGTYIEISSRHKVPSDFAIEELLNTNVEFIINSDAHHPNQVGHYDYAIALIKKYGIEDRVVNLGDRNPNFRSKR